MLECGGMAQSLSQNMEKLFLLCAITFGSRRKGIECIVIARIGDLNVCGIGLPKIQGENHIFVYHSFGESESMLCKNVTMIQSHTRRSELIEIAREFLLHDTTFGTYAPITNLHAVEVGNIW